MTRLSRFGRGWSRLRWYVLAAFAAGTPIVAAAISVAASSRPDGPSLLGIAMFLGFACVAELRPMPVDPEGRREVSLAFIFIISSQLIFGWEWAVLTGVVGIGIAVVSARLTLLKIVFNCSAYAIAAGLAAVAGSLLAGTAGEHGYAGVVALTIACGAVFVVVNVLLVCFAICLSTGTSVRATFVDHLRHSGPLFVIMAFVAAQAVIFWHLSAALVLLLSAPIFALTLYQRSYLRSRTAEVAAATDSLTALKNRRAFDEDATRALQAAAPGRELSLCLIDIDHFKQVNDRHGHGTGDAVLELLARAIGELAPRFSYRLGGDELAFMVEGPAEAALETAASIRALFSARQTDLLPEPVTISAGIAVFPDHADDLHSLLKHADLALYQSKNNGRARSTVYTVRDNAAHGEEIMSSAFPLVDIRLVTARRLATLVDALATASPDAAGNLPAPAYTDVLDRWQSYDGRQSEAVASLTVALGRRLGLSTEELDQVRLAALLRDVGTIAVPGSILGKPGPLLDNERDLIERHPVIGFELLRDLGLSPVDTYVRHHHERWDGQGYPDRLAGPEIPLGSRLILVADAFDALTSDRAYRKRVSIEAAMHELQGEVGRQFDPLVVAALHAHLSQPAKSGDSQAELEVAWSF